MSQQTAAPSNLKTYMDKLAKLDAGVWIGTVCETCEQDIEEFTYECACAEDLRDPDIFDPLEIEFVRNAREEVVGVNLLITSGGPAVWLTARLYYGTQLSGAWGSDSLLIDVSHEAGRPDTSDIVTHYEEAAG